MQVVKTPLSEYHIHKLFLIKMNKSGTTLVVVHSYMNMVIPPIPPEIQHFPCIVPAILQHKEPMPTYM